MSDRPVRTIGQQEAAAAARLMRDHGARLALYEAQEKAEREAAWSGPAVHNGHARHEVELAKRRQLRDELRQALDAPLIRAGILSPDERQQIKVAEALRRRPARAP